MTRSMMRVIQMTAAGVTEALQLHNIAVAPLPSSQHIRIKLSADAINPIDAKLRSKPTYFPDITRAILGRDGANVEQTVSADVTRFAARDEVYSCNGGIGDEPCSYAEDTTLHEEYAVHKPVTFSMAENAVLPLVLIMVWETLLERAHLHARQTVLMHAGAGGARHITIQIALHFEAHVAVTVSDGATLVTDD